MPPLAQFLVALALLAPIVAHCCADELGAVVETVLG